ncbi:MAG: hypothetical protein AAFY71_18235 [Bacteroidota bacterium]
MTKLINHMNKGFHTIQLLLTILLLGGLSSNLFAQNERDAYRHSQTIPTGSARMMAMGGAYSAAGGDVGVSTINPAGLGIFRSSVYSFSPTYSFGTVNSNFIDASGSGNSRYFGMPNWGAAFTTMNYENEEQARRSRNKIKSYTISFGHNQTENYHRNSVVQGAFNQFSSITNMFAEMAQGQDFNDLLGSSSFPGLALQTFMIEVIADQADSLDYYGAADRGMIEQTVQIQERGKRNEWYGAVGANIADKLYIGGAVTWERVRYQQNFTFSEADIDNNYEVYDPFQFNGFPLELPLSSLSFRDTFSTSGSGIGATFGLIYRPSDAIRVAFSAKTPTFYTLTDFFDNSFTTVIENNTGTEEIQALPAEAGTFRYNLLTPFRLTGGLMLQLQKYGFLTADLEYLDYRTSRLSSFETNINSPGYYSFSDENAAIRNDYTSALNVRVGAEGRFNIFRVRVGGALYGTGLNAASREYVDDIDFTTQRSVNNNRLVLTGGLGIRQRNFFVDVSIVNWRQEDKVSPYSLSTPDSFQPNLVSNRIVNNITATIGFNY